MANKQFTDLTAISSVDGAADILAIYDDSATELKKTTRNTLLNLASAPVGLTDVQTLTNKTLTQPVINVDDDEFTLQDNADTTKKVQFQLSGVTTGTTRTLTVPDASDTLVTLATTQTLTNKTMTSPTLNTPTITNPTITTDTISEYTAANGVAVDSLNIKDGKLNTNDSVVTSNITDGAVQPKKLQSGTGTSWVWQSWAPTWTGLTTGDGTLQYAKYIQHGKTVRFRLRFVLGTTSSIGGVPTFTLPVTMHSDYSQSLIEGFTGGAHLRDTSATTTHFAVPVYVSSTTASVRYLGTNSAQTAVSSSAPFTWADEDQIFIHGVYEAA